MNKLIITDLDGTLVDTRECNYLAYADALAQFGIHLDREWFYSKCYGRHFREFIPELVKNTSLYSRIHQAKQMFYLRHLGRARVNDFLVDMLRMMRSAYKTALVTTASRRNCMQILARFSLVPLFDLIVTGDDVENHKPDPEGIIKAIDYFGSSPLQTVAFDDMPQGIEAAKRAGIKSFMPYGF